MIEEITTNIIQCDAPNCDEVYFDCIPLSADAIAKCAIRDGWSQLEWRWTCPSCRVTVQQRDHQIESMQKEIDKQEKTIARLLQGKFKKGELDELATILPPDDLALALVQARRVVAKREKDTPETWTPEEILINEG